MFSKRALMLAATSTGVLAFGASSAQADSVLDYLNIGEDGDASQLVFKLTNFDNGTVYPDLSQDGGSAPYTRGVSASSEEEVEQGINELNDLQVTDAVGSLNPNGDDLGTEDSWGIFRVSTIQDESSNILWQNGDGGLELTAMFYGERDHFIEQNANGVQTIEGSGLNVDFYEDESENYDATAGSEGRTGLDSYETVTDGNLVLQTLAEAGHINNLGENGGPETEFRSFFDPLTGAADISAKGLSFLSVVGGDWASLFDTDRFEVSDDNAELGYLPADMKTEFTIDNTNVGPGENDWLVTSNDPITAFAIPTPSAALLGMAMLGGLSLQRRRQRA